ncbi:S-layer homology domain-containing protein [Acaryochloris sp. CCMEE 5410]|uniref:S-layer homology domain-containing protein n=1 Tax=Acaryochloris sp. CCMEE 5410 TaxID=310037 RepID=UPI0002484C9D|nr:S-layer homology domain-containing protein [Acaryochloris sp. CCMEE 5410]KAI9132752.1 S-layer homology domain-containing protein [Acaryochloris sp. CCMEE 5410]
MFSAPQRAVAVACLTSVIAVAPVPMRSAFAQSQFTDVSSNWAQPFIDTLAQKNIISGFPDGSFRPDQPVTRAQFAAIVRQAFKSPATRPSRPFKDVSYGYWASPAIDYAYTTGFLSGYTNGSFQPDQEIPKVQALVAIASGLKIQPVGSVDSTLLRFYDAAQIPNYAKPGVAAATQRNIPVNYPNAATLNPNQQATRADIAAYIYQALVSQGRLAPIGSNFPASQYIVQGGSLPATPSEAGTGTLAVGTKLPVQLEGAEPGANLVMTVGENVETTFVVAEDVVNTNQQVVIPEGSKIVGRFQPFEVNKTLVTQFTASKLMIGNTPYTVNASSVPIAARKKSSLSIADLTGSITTLAASAALDSAISGNVRFGSLVPGIIQTGQTIGKQVIGKSDTSDEVILVEPDLMGLKLNADFEFLPGSTTAFVDPNSANLYQVDSGTKVDLVAQTDNARYVMVPGETVPVALKTGRSIYNRQNEVLVPEGSLIRGQIVPMTVNGKEGAQFVANEIMIGTQTYPITAASAVISPSSLQSLSPADFQGNVIASPEASQSLRGVSSTGEQQSGGLLGLSSLIGGSGSGKKVILFNPTSVQMEFRAPLSLNNFNN